MADWPSAQTGMTRITQPDALTSAEYGENLVSNASNNVKGVWKEFHAALPFDAVGFFLQITDISAIANYLIDVGIGAASSETVLVPNISAAGGRANAYFGNSYWPVRIPKGTRVAMRCQASVGGSTVAANILFVHGGFHSDLGLSRVTTYNADTSTSTAGSIDPGGSANTFTTWTQVSASTTAPMHGVVVNVHQGNAAVTACAWMFEVGVRTSGPVDTALVPGIVYKTDVNYDQIPSPMAGPFPLFIPTGSDLRVRIKCTTTDATDRVVRFTLFGLD